MAASGETSQIFSLALYYDIDKISILVLIQTKADPLTSESGSLASTSV
jgi:hypothetical protein